MYSSSYTSLHHLIPLHFTQNIIFAVDTLVLSMAAVASLSSFAFPHPPPTPCRKEHDATDTFNSETSRSPSPVPQLRPDDVAAKDEEADRLLEALGRKLSHVRIDSELSNTATNEADWDDVTNMVSVMVSVSFSFRLPFSFAVALLRVHRGMT